MRDKIWLKRVLIPTWVLQIIVCGVFAVAAILSLWIVDQDDVGDRLEAAVHTSASIQLSFSVFTILAVVAEIILVCAHKLRPVTNIVIQAIKSLIWTVFFIMIIIAAAQRSISGLSVFLVVVLFLTCMTQLAYGAVIVHRYRKGTLYSRSNPTSGNGFADGTTYGGNNAQPGSYAAPYQDPFRDPSQTSLPYHAQPGQPAHSSYKPTGSAANHYDGNPQSYELQAPGTRF